MSSDGRVSASGDFFILFKSEAELRSKCDLRQWCYLGARALTLSALLVKPFEILDLLVRFSAIFLVHHNCTSAHLAWQGVLRASSGAKWPRSRLDCVRVVWCNWMSCPGKSVREKVFSGLFPLVNPTVCLGWILPLAVSVNAEGGVCFIFSYTSTCPSFVAYIETWEIQSG